MVLHEAATSTLILGSALLALTVAAWQYWRVSKVTVGAKKLDEESPLTQIGADTDYLLRWVSEEIRNGAKSFLFAEYRFCAYFIVVFGAAIFAMISWGQGSAFEGLLSTFAFVLGASTSILCGYIGMMGTSRARRAAPPRPRAHPRLTPRLSLRTPRAAAPQWRSTATCARPSARRTASAPAA